MESSLRSAEARHARLVQVVNRREARSVRVTATHGMPQCPIHPSTIFYLSVWLTDTRLLNTCSPNHSDAGQFLNTTVDECQPCKPGFFTNKPGRTSCYSCRVGETSAETYCSPCNAGKWHEPSSNSCIDCSAGTFSGRTGMTACEMCKYSETSVDAATFWYVHTPQSSCCHCHLTIICSPICSSACPAGQYLKRVESEVPACTNCSDGEFAVAGSVSCSLCPAGRAASSDKSTCDLCPPGRHGAGVIGLSSTQSCTQCDAGKWSAASGIETDTGCLDCPSGRETRPVGTNGTVTYSEEIVCMDKEEISARPITLGSVFGSLVLVVVILLWLKRTSKTSEEIMYRLIGELASVIVTLCLEFGDILTDIIVSFYAGVFPSIASEV